MAEDTATETVIAPRMMDEAADWFLRRGEGLSDDQRRAFEAWLVADPAHGMAHARIARAMAALDIHAEEPALAALREEARAPSRSPAWHSWRMGIAAGFAALALGFGAWWHAAPGPATRWLTSGKGEERVFALADGSHVTLDTDSQVAVTLAPHRRSLTLTRGRAYFQVAHDRARPFVVTAGAREVVAVGTEFSVARQASDVTVVLTHGRVRVEPANADLAGKPPVDTAYLSVGQSLRFEGATGRSRIGQVDTALTNGWRQGRLQFEQTPLSAAVAEFDRYGGVPLRIVDPAVAALPVTGVFAANNTRGFAQAVAVLLPVVAARRAGVIELSRR